MKEQYLLTKECIGTSAQIDYKKMRGFQVRPKNKVPYEGVVVNKMLLIKPSFIEKVLKRKIKRKLDCYLQFIIKILDDTDDDDEGAIDIALNDLSRYRATIQNTYRVFLEKRYYDLLMKKITVIENELKTKQMYLRATYQDTYIEHEEKKGKGR